MIKICSGCNKPYLDNGVGWVFFKGGKEIICPGCIEKEELKCKMIRNGIDARVELNQKNCLNWRPNETK